jgi:DNA-binding protein H-NS
MRKPRDYDSELKALNDKARTLKERRVRQLGELVIASGADALTPEQLAGALLAAIDADAAAKEAWRKRGAGFFQRTTRGAGTGVTGDPGGATPRDGGTTSA